MSAEVLRRAAALMRERAKAAPGSVWKHGEFEGGNRDQRRTLGTYSMVHDTEAEVAIVRGFSEERTATADHIASWNPAVALAVADLLDDAAEGEDEWQKYGDPQLRPVANLEAFAVARAYLGESA